MTPTEPATPSDTITIDDVPYVYEPMDPPPELDAAGLPIPGT